LKTNTGAPKAAKEIVILEVLATDGAAAIFENAGRHPDPSSRQGEAFIRNLENRWGESPRFLWPAVQQNMRHVRREVQDVIDNWLDDFEQRMDDL